MLYLLCNWSRVKHAIIEQGMVIPPDWILDPVHSHLRSRHLCLDSCLRPRCLGQTCG